MIVRESLSEKRLVKNEGSRLLFALLTLARASNIPLRITKLEGERKKLTKIFVRKTFFIITGAFCPLPLKIENDSSVLRL